MIEMEDILRLADELRAQESYMDKERWMKENGFSIETMAEIVDGYANTLSTLIGREPDKYEFLQSRLAFAAAFSFGYEVHKHLGGET